MRENRRGEREKDRRRKPNRCLDTGGVATQAVVAVLEERSRGEVSQRGVDWC